MSMKKWASVWAVTFVTLPIHMASAADEVEQFYKDKQVKLISAYAAGGNSALYGDVLRRHIGRHIPGNPIVIIQNMPGGAGITATNYMAKRAPRDGTEFALVSRTAPFEPLYGNDKALYSTQELSWLGSANVETSVCIANTNAPVDSLKAATEKELIVGGSSPDALDSVLPNITNRLLGTKFKIVGGYPLSSDIILAMERGEVSGFCGVSWASINMRYANLLKDKKIKVLFQFAPERASDLKDVPLIQEEAKSKIDSQVFDLLLAPQQMGRPFLTAPGVPPARLAALRKAFMDTLKDAEFLAEAQKAGLEIQPIGAEAVDKILARAYASSPEAIEKMKQLLAYK